MQAIQKQAIEVLGYIQNKSFEVFGYVKNKSIDLYSNLPRSTQTIVAAGSALTLIAGITNNTFKTELPSTAAILTNTMKLATMDYFIVPNLSRLPSLSAIKTSCSEKLGEDHFITKSAVYVESSAEYMSQYTASIDSKIAATIALDLMAIPLISKISGANLSIPTFLLYDGAIITYNEIYNSYDTPEITAEVTDL